MLPDPAVTGSDYLIDDDLLAGAPPDPALAAAAAGTLTVDPRGPLYSAVAQALATDAATAVADGVPWNVIRIPGMSAYEVRVGLSRHLQINSPADWVSYLGTTLDHGGIGDIDTVLRVRAEAARSAGTDLAADEWTGAVRDWLHATNQPDAAYAALDRLAPAIDEVDGWLRETHVLPPGVLLPGIVGHQASYAVTAIRYGAQSGYADHAAVTQGLLAVVDLITGRAASWREYAATVLAGAALTAEPDERRARFAALLPAVATCLTARDSPWRTLRYPLPELTITDFQEDSWDY
ncbi:DUF1266 domain-containing protein [Gordonia amarae]|uniref:DUF1266 domain-containing protein n=2 Tax=Gordonia amarae TaxID=36821 RepID=G7GTA3_9ACTN|nr:DUF1266 domain-containing protein [Gordonia amarae]MCS3880046.1 hypothetical protein [Gordonia amarae]QHN18426.1 DUF1266 domain-containing protein [Gordonia amarae]QHN22908.1 DUF1266 domain-containing protein [Gordonia amarae]QHN31811.1 DUF1266 domain-containing protein [Gordonia amarae]QHN40557.1 DUF1266 domain-containing protein [Gordonia amarae]